jgi:hypothetical protein
MKGSNGVQFCASQRFIDFKKDVKNKRIIAGKEGNGELSDKRLSVTMVKILSLPQNYNLLINADIDLRKED